MQWRILCFCFSILLFSCSTSQSEKPTGFTTVTTNFSKETCIEESCAKVDFTWPELKNKVASIQINQAIQDQLRAYFYADSLAPTLEGQADRYLKDFLETKSAFPEMPGDWEIKVDAVVSFDSLSTLTVFFSEFNFSGGAHPNSSNYFMNFDRESGEFLSMDRLVLDQQKMKVLAELAFRAFHEVDEAKSLAEDGRFFLPEAAFFLPNSMGFKDGKFHLIYNPYEIGPYVMGYTDLEFTLEEVRGLVRI